MMDRDQTEIKISLKAARVNANLTVIQASKKIGLSPSTLLKYEKNPDLINMKLQKKLSAAYGIPIKFIFFGE